MHVIIRTFGSAEYLRHRGSLTTGELVFHDITPRRSPPPMIAVIQRVVASHFATDICEMKSARRSREVARPRQVAMYLSRELTPKSLPEIGRLFGNRDHTTVIHAIRQIEHLMLIDQELKDSVRALRLELQA